MKQLTLAQRKGILQILTQSCVAFLFMAVQIAVRQYQCCERTIWNIWARRTNINAKVRCPKNPKEHTKIEHDLIVSVLAEYPHESYTKIYTELFNRGYNRTYKGLWGYVNKHKLRGDNYIKYSHHVNKPYNRPKMLGMKMQMDIKYVPRSCMTEKYYQYTLIDESNAKTFEMAFPEKSTYSTKHFLICAFRRFHYLPLTVQTDNGTEFTNRLIAGEEHKINLVDDYLFSKNITHKLIRPATPQHNCYVERRHREDHRNYQNKKFSNLAELNAHLRKWCKDKDNTFTFSLCSKCRKSPNMRQAEQIQELRDFAKSLNLNRKTTLQEMIYAYAERERILQERQEDPPKFITKLPFGIVLAEDIQFALLKI